MEIKELDKFQTVLNHSKRVLDPADISLITKLQGEFQKALCIQQSAATASADASKKPAISSVAGMSQGLKASLKSFMGKRREAAGGAVKFQNQIVEAENEEDDS